MYTIYIMGFRIPFILCIPLYTIFQFGDFGQKISGYTMVYPWLNGIPWFANWLQQLAVASRSREKDESSKMDPVPLMNDGTYTLWIPLVN